MSDNAEEQDRQAAETNRIGAEGNRISAETDRISAELARSEAALTLVSSRQRKDVGQLLAYVLIVLVAAGGFYQMNKVDQRVCEAAEENRTSLRALVIALDALGKDLITDGKPLSKLDSEEIVAVKKFESFTVAQLKILDVPAC